MNSLVFKCAELFYDSLFSIAHDVHPIPLPVGLKPQDLSLVAQAAYATKSLYSAIFNEKSFSVSNFPNADKRFWNYIYHLLKGTDLKNIHDDYDLKHAHNTCLNFADDLRRIKAQIQNPTFKMLLEQIIQGLLLRARGLFSLMSISMKENIKALIEPEATDPSANLLQPLPQANLAQNAPTNPAIRLASLLIQKLASLPISRFR
jgi:hypothetical protein